MTTPIRLAARSVRETGQGRVDTIYRLLTLPPKAFIGAKRERIAAAARILAREALGLAIWESEGGALA